MNKDAISLCSLYAGQIIGLASGMTDEAIDHLVKDPEFRYGREIQAIQQLRITCGFSKRKEVTKLP